MANVSDRQCAHCGKLFKYPSELGKHLAAKRKCVPRFANITETAAYNCRFCGRGFGNKTHMYRHIRDRCNIAPNVKNGDTGMERFYEHTLQKQLADQKVEIESLKTQNAEILALLRQQGAGGTNTLQAGEVAIQAGDYAQVDNSKKIVINVFGQEKLDHVTAERIKTILDECLQRPALPTAVDEAVG